MKIPRFGRPKILAALCHLSIFFSVVPLFGQGHSDHLFKILRVDPSLVNQSPYCESIQKSEEDFLGPTKIDTTNILGNLPDPWKPLVQIFDSELERLASIFPVVRQFFPIKSIDVDSRCTEDGVSSLSGGVYLFRGTLGSVNIIRHEFGHLIGEAYFAVYGESLINKMINNTNFSHNIQPQQFKQHSYAIEFGFSMSETIADAYALSINPKANIANRTFLNPIFFSEESLKGQRGEFDEHQASKVINSFILEAGRRLGRPDLIQKWFQGILASLPVEDVYRPYFWTAKDFIALSFRLNLGEILDRFEIDNLLQNERKLFHRLRGQFGLDDKNIEKVNLKVEKI